MAKRPFEVRRARIEDRAAMIDCIERAFTPAGGQRRSFTALLPHLFTDARIPQHWVAVGGGAIVGTVGCYPYTWRHRGVDFRSAGIGQVSTAQEWRGEGVMSALMTAALAEAASYDFLWLYGDRKRYRTFGFGDGGRSWRFETFDRYLPAPPPEGEARPLDPQRELGRVRAAFERSSHLVVDDAELRCFLTRSETRATVFRGAFIVTDPSGTTIHDGDGPDAELELLLAHANREARKLPGDHWKLTIACDAVDSPLLRIARERFWNHRLEEPGMFRLGDLAGFLGRLARLAPSGLADGAFTLTDETGGGSATLVVAAGRARVDARPDGPEIRLSTDRLAEFVFGLLPVAAMRPDIPADHPIHRLLPVPLYLSNFWAL